MKIVAGIAVYLGAVALTLGVVSPIIKNAKKEDEYLKRQFNKSLSEGKISVASEESQNGFNNKGGCSICADL